MEKKIDKKIKELKIEEDGLANYIKYLDREGKSYQIKIIEP